MAIICIISNTTDRQATVERIAKLYKKSVNEFVSVDLQAGFSRQVPKDVSEVILSGGTFIKLAGQPELQSEIDDFIINLDRPLLGICFGAQLIAHAYGSRIMQLPTKVEGASRLRILRGSAFYEGKYILSVYKKQDWSLQELPEELKVIGCSDQGVDIFVHQDKPVAGVQFHPELFAKTTDGELAFQGTLALRNSLLK